MLHSVAARNIRSKAGAARSTRPSRSTMNTLTAFTAVCRRIHCRQPTPPPVTATASPSSRTIAAISMPTPLFRTSPPTFAGRVRGHPRPRRDCPAARRASPWYKMYRSKLADAPASPTCPGARLYLSNRGDVPLRRNLHWNPDVAKIGPALDLSAHFSYECHPIHRCP